ncbi:MAG: hypothetical protein ABFD69_08940 [Candidatus Sumerlaeia bacterium]
MMLPVAPRHPIVLVHGLGGFDCVRIELLRLYSVQIEYFNGIADRLRARGATVHTAALPPGGAIAERAEALRRFIDANVREPKFHLVAHSMGGLDSRHYLTALSGAERAVSLTTLATPHHGSALADLTTLHLIEPVARLLGKFGPQQWVEELYRQTAAHSDLRPASCAEFNARTPNAPGVAYYSWAGEPPNAALHGLLQLPGAVLARLEDGPNDGLVSVGSAKWSGWRGTVPADHISLVGWQFTRAARDRFDPAAFYDKLIPDLLAAEAG